MQLTAAYGEQLSLNTYRNRWNLVVVFLPRKTETDVRAFLESFRPFLPEYRDRDARVLIILSGREEAAPGRADSLGPELRVAVDAGQEAQAAFEDLIPARQSGRVPEAGQGAAFVIDRFGAPYAASRSLDPSGKFDHQEAIAWLDFIEIQCPECGIPEWPV